MATKEIIERILEEQRDLFLKKLHDYGTEDIKVLGISGVTNRIFEKLKRAENLITKDGVAFYENLKDTFMDIMGYALIATLLNDGKWDLLDPAEIDVNEDETKLLIQRTEEAKNFDLPRPKKRGDVGFDLYTVKNTLIPTHNAMPTDVPTGVRVKLPKGTWALVINRSSAPRKLGIEVVPGLIDNGYTGELFACCFNRTGKDLTLEAGTRVAQFVIFPISVPTIKEVDLLPETERGETGFGSTGFK